MHGSTFIGDGARALMDLDSALREIFDAAEQQGAETALAG